MRIREGFIKKPFMDEIVIVPTGEASDNFQGIVKLNETASIVWDSVSEGMDVADIAKKISETYDVDIEKAKNDAQEVIDQMKEAGFFIEDEADL